MVLKNDRLLRVLKGQPVDRTPVWIMRQAGRYLPEYRAIREKVGSFLGMSQDPVIATEITCQPLQRFELDAAIIFADILFIPDAMGAELSFVAQEGPKFAKPCREMKDVDALREVNPNQQLSYVLEAIDRTKSQIEVPLLGFCGSPWTVATYMVEGGTTKDFRRVKQMLYAQPAVLTALLEKLTDASIEYLSAQVKAGADALMIFDTWGGVLTASAYETFSYRSMQKIVQSLKARHPDTPITLFTKGGGLQSISLLAQSGCHGIGLDWQTSLAQARELVRDDVALQGNLDPSCLYAPKSEIELFVKQTLESYGSGHRHILNLGHGVHQDIDPSHVQVFVEAAHRYSPAYHQ